MVYRPVLPLLCKYVLLTQGLWNFFAEQELPKQDVFPKHTNNIKLSTQSNIGCPSDISACFCTEQSFPSGLLYQVKHQDTAIVHFFPECGVS